MHFLSATFFKKWSRIALHKNLRAIQSTDRKENGTCFYPFLWVGSSLPMGVTVFKLQVITVIET